MEQELVTVASYAHAMEAHAVRNLLEENGICAFVADEHTVTMESWSFLVGIKVQVAATDAERAVELLSRPYAGGWLIDEALDEFDCEEE